VSISRQAIEAVAPDQSALSAATRISPASWASIEQATDRNLAWGQCQGSGSTPYRVAVDLNDLGSKCTCPSRKFPCKHGLGLMLALLDSPASVAAAPVPDWVEDWVSRRRPATRPRADRPSVSLDAATDEVSDAPTEADVARAAAQRERLRALREQGILDGLDELDRWIADQIDKGLATFAQRATQQCRLAAQRLIDAKAPALATRIDALPSRLLALPEAERGPFAIEALASLHLLASAYRRQNLLPERLREDVRRLVGWTIERHDLLEHPLAEILSAAWLVLAVRAEVQPDNLKRVETWLMTLDRQPARFAVLIDFIPVALGRSSGSGHIPGEAFDATLVFYPSVTPLRAALVSRGEARAADWPEVSSGVEDALATFDAALVANPWLAAWPVLIGDPRIAAIGRQKVLTDTQAAAVLPVNPADHDAVAGLAAARLAAVAGLWDGSHLSPLAAHTALGPWYAS
jgi:hypothetical protein